MNLFEYQGKDLYKKYSITTPKSIFINSISDLTENHGLSFPLVVKAQVQVGGRGKAGGIKVAKNHQELEEHIDAILGMDIKGHKVESLLIEEASEIISEYYISFTLDRSEKKYLMMLSSKGGMDIEEVAIKTPEKIITTKVDLTENISDEDCNKIIKIFNLKDASRDEAINLIKSIYKMFIDTDANLVEINPLILTKDNKVICLDAKMNFDSNALFRQNEIMELRDLNEEDDTEIEASKHDLAYIKLDGSIGCMVNGAGLAMATMDIIKLYGEEPANFLDVGGGASKEKVSAAFKIILSDKNVKGILINIFGGIMRCDVLAQGVVDAAKEINISVPLVVRLAGTNFKEGKEILDSSGLKLISAENLDDAAKKIVEAIK